MIRKIAIALVVLTMVAGGAFLAMYAGADDAPGGVLLGIVVMGGAVGLGAMSLQRTAGSSRSG